MDLIGLIKSDWKINSTISSIILMFYRIKHFMYINNHGNFLKIIEIVEILISIFLNLNAQISYKAEIGNNIRLLHKGEGVIISSKAIIGNNCTILHQVTIGINEAKVDKDIIIGNNCFLGAGSKVISCKICNNCKIGANAVVVKDIPSPSIVYSINKVSKLDD